MPDGPVSRRIRGFVYESSRRRVFRVLLAYTVFGVGTAKGADIVLPSLGFPAYTVNLVVILVVIGLPVAVGLAWAFEVVPDQSAIAGATDPPAESAENAAARGTLGQDLFRQALEVPEDERSAFLEEAAVNDEALPTRLVGRERELKSPKRETDESLAAYGESLAAYEEGVRLARRAGRADDLAHALTVQADALMTVGKAADAISPYEEAVDILSQLATDNTLSETLGKLAKAHEAGGRAVDASAAWGLAKEICVTLDDRAGALEATEHEVRLLEGANS